MRIFRILENVWMPFDGICWMHSQKLSTFSRILNIHGIFNINRERKFQRISMNFRMWLPPRVLLIMDFDDSFLYHLDYCSSFQICCLYFFYYFSFFKIYIFSITGIFGFFCLFFNTMCLICLSILWKLSKNVFSIERMIPKIF